ncbi:MAG: hypothetical protein KDC31_09865 [Saprospiraceae bacterium]|jgi:hypothetical protein|nr:hypothetical protein [Saprospiraceae bacterium]MBX7178332.1 hypothetical protein [Saprospiraceae bacterium]MCB0591587.1 hypothetical protein [Saprospiraceae bacterium]MCO5283274.1 DUF5689 domain-containing protein [Saprospiraceae bacterium]MCO6471563.1 hypothetical protein [Saprospiraceae bacterium]
MTRFINSFLFTAFMATLFLGCVKTDIDEPPYNTNYPTYNANFSIKDLRALHTNGKFETINEDYLIKAVVVADDKSGNYYKTLVVQDSTGGMEVKINAVGLFNTFPVGRRVYLKLKGLTLGDYNGNFQIGGGTYLDDSNNNRLGGIEEPVVNQYILKGEFNVPITPAVKTIAELGDGDINTLVQLNGLEVPEADLGATYADAVNKTTTNRTLKDCSNKTITLRTSGYATFAGLEMPQGNGTIVAIYTVFGATKQLFLREASDADFSGKRCGDGGVTGELINISDVRALYQGSTISLPDNKKIKGIVISDKTYANITNKNLVLWQSGNAGITLRFTETVPFNVGDELEIGISGLELSEFNGLLQINNAPLTNVSRTGTGKTVTPTELSIDNLNANIKVYESQLVKIKGVTLSKSNGTTFSGTVNAKDATGSIALYTTSYSTFANDNFPTGTVDIVAIASRGGSNSENQLTIRSKDDISGGVVNPGETIDISAVRALYAGAATTVPASKSIKGIVISDKTFSNITSKNVVIQQEGNAGIVVRFSANNTLNLGDEVEIAIGGMELSEFNGLLQLNNVPNANAKVVGTGKSINPVTITLNELVSNLENYESTLIKVVGVTLSKSSGSTFEGTVVMTDATGTANMYTTSYATFAKDNFPTGVVNVTGIVGQFDTPQVNIRSKADIN